VPNLVLKTGEVADFADLIAHQFPTLDMNQFVTDMI
jgi:hypothetical protein